MKQMIFKYRTMLLLVAILVTSHGCYKDLGNYNYNSLPEVVNIASDSYNNAYTKALGDSLIVDPTVSYGGDASDLSFSWQIWNDTNHKYITFKQGKKLKIKCGNTQGTDTLIPSAGAYSIRLAVVNNQLKTNSDNPNANEVYSANITITVVDASYRGLMVLHGDGQKCDVGLIEANIFLPTASDNVTTKVTPNFYSYFNNGERISGIGKQVFQYGHISTWGSQTYGTSNIYVFTDKGGIQANYLKLQKTAIDYSAMFANSADASGKPQFFTQKGQAQGRTLIDNGRVFYGDFYGALFTSDYAPYYAAPFAAQIGRSDFSGNSSIGTVVFDNVHKCFLYSGYGSGTSYLNRFPSSTVSSVDLQPNDMKASLLYMEKRGSGKGTDRPSVYDVLAVMKDDATGEKYLADFNFTVLDFAQASVGRYSMEALPEAKDIKYYAFGAGFNVNYYATKQNIYQYQYMNNNTAGLIYTFPNSEEITLMKIIKYEYSIGSTNYYQFSNKVMVVATVDAQGHGKIYTFKIDVITGALTLAATFNGTESGGSNFGSIYDANLKDQ